MSKIDFPRLISIPIPGNLKPERLGDYLTMKAHDLMKDIGLGALVPMSAYIRYYDGKYFLEVRTNAQYTIPNSVDVFEKDEETTPLPPSINTPAMESPKTLSGISVRPKGGPSKANKDKNTGELDRSL